MNRVYISHPGNGLQRVSGARETENDLVTYLQPRPAPRVDNAEGERGAGGKGM